LNFGFASDFDIRISDFYQTGFGSTTYGYCDEKGELAEEQCGCLYLLCDLHGGLSCFTGDP